LATSAYSNLQVRASPPASIERTSCKVGITLECSDDDDERSPSTLCGAIIQLMKKLIALPLLLAVGAANADTAGYSVGMRRVDISKMTCAEVQSELEAGPVLFTWHSRTGMPRWGMYMSRRGSCKMQQMKVRASVATADTKSCRVYQCSQYGRSPYR
jgi:hypothetical protein